jgi:pimeloyl-ACP methyl ester carboxylesterase
MVKTDRSPADYVRPLNMNGLEGRMLYVPADKKPQSSVDVLLVYGHHSSLERWWGLVEVLGRYGNVTLPDLPGFGGMDSLYTIGKKPTVDNLADYLAAFIKLRYKNKKFVIVGMSFGFVVVTRMLQRYPELTKHVRLLVSFVGFADSTDFGFSRRIYWFYRSGTTLFSTAPTAFFFRHVFLRPFILRYVYSRTGHRKFVDLPPEQIQPMIDVEIDLWHSNDVRTWTYTTQAFLHFTNCDRQVDLPLWHIAVEGDHFFKNDRVEQHMRVIFSDFHCMPIRMTKHAPTVIATAKEAEIYIPPALHREFLALSK